jgi:hypothetical protein
MTLNHRGVGVEVNNKTWEFVALRVNQSVTVCVRVSDQAESLSHLSSVHKLGMDQLALTLYLVKGEKPNGDPSGPPVTTP